MKKMKFDVLDAQHSEEIQKALFAEGYAWSYNEKTVKNTDAKYLFAGTFDDNCITYSRDDTQYFAEHGNEEYVLTPFGTLVKAADYFKQPETPAMKIGSLSAITVNTGSVPASAPIGLVPKNIHDSNRIREIVDAMQRFASDNRRVPAEWISELQYLNNLVE